MCEQWLGEPLGKKCRGSDRLNARCKGLIVSSSPFTIDIRLDAGGRAHEDEGAKANVAMKCRFEREAAAHAVADEYTVASGVANGACRFCVVQIS